MELITNTNYSPELMEVVKLYFPQNFQTVEAKIEINKIGNDEKVFDCESKIECFGRVIESKKHCVINEFMNEKKLIKVALYELLSKFFVKDMPWGALTGIRPTKLAHDLMKKGMSVLQMRKFLQQNYYVSKEKTDLVCEIVMNQKDFLSTNEKDIDLYINIPFCVSRCSYCSFISALVGCSGHLIEPYIEALIKEIEHTKKIIQEKSYIVRSIYIGGGTPTSFTVEQLEKILSHIGYPANEFTIEAGRPDTITKEKLDLFKKHNVTRICINPQTFNDTILKKIGRTHTALDIVNIYNMARKYPFKINMDFIAGLPGETIKSFKDSIESGIALQPDSITVHTLCLKRASTYSNEQVDIFKDAIKVEKMVNYSNEILTESGYKPYYMYRQKNMLSALENVSYAKDKSYSKFNIDSMEESTSVIACGANAISKRIYRTQNRIERQANLKDIKEYVTRIDEMIEKKKKLFE
ncbi:MAG: coproporphyrinogen dehydrogenase HemZ [Clostridia bacterium]|nr:coproporphyrinogen dehydrogenase HemZ [Clostridia bacterium]